MSKYLVYVLLTIPSTCLLFLYMQKTPVFQSEATVDSENKSLSLKECSNVDYTAIQPTEIIQPLNLIFDFNGVLFIISKKRAVNRLGLFDIISYTMGGNKVEALEDVIFEILYQLDGQPTRNQPTDLLPMHYDKPLPTIMCKWMLGTMSSQEVLDKTLPFVEQLYKDGFFKNRTEKKLVTKILTLMFDPAVRCDLYKPLKKGITLLKTCKSYGHKLYLLSNIDTELIDLMKQKYPDVFELFDGIVVSADVHMMKPHADIYEYMLHTFKLDPVLSCLIDDQKENTQGAKRLHMRAIHHNKNKTKRTYRKLISFGALPADILPPATAQGKQKNNLPQVPS